MDRMHAIDDLLGALRKRLAKVEANIKKVRWCSLPACSTCLQTLLGITCCRLCSTWAGLRQLVSVHEFSGKACLDAECPLHCSLVPRLRKAPRLT